jgi:NAD(P)H-hydrate epimerase
MERAATACVSWIGSRFAGDTVFIILCGIGNNGGDGLAITRLLHQQGYIAKAFLLQIKPELSEDCGRNLQLLQKIDDNLVQILQPGTFITDIPQHIVVIDAILGTGLNREPDDWVRSFIVHINEIPNRKLAIDIPSGMPADMIPEHPEHILRVNDTLSFQFYKRSFLHAETGKACGALHILDIDLNDTFIKATHSSYCIIDELLAGGIYKKRMPFSHKGTYGTAFIVAGSYGMMGAASLTVKAACRAGAGKVKVLIPECGYNILQTSVPEAMCVTQGDKHLGRICEWEGAQAIGIGPGIGTRNETARALADFIEKCKQPIVLDADALNILSAQPELLHKLPTHSILTPHPKEFEKLFGPTGNSMQMLELARTKAMKFNIYIVLKGRYTAIVSPDGECRYNVTGNPGMATGGSGDVLTGIITGLLAQGYEPFDAATLGVYIHGLAGDKAAEDISEYSLIAGDIILSLGKAFKEVNNYC